jgi:hypothetical protein
MTTAEQIFLRLDAYEVLGKGVRVSARSSVSGVSGVFDVEPVVVNRGDADFGSVGGQMSVTDLNDIRALWAKRMQQLSADFIPTGPKWQARDSAAFTDWKADYVRLQNRYNTALASVKSAGSWTPLPDSMSPAQSEYDTLSRAMAQNYPPDGAPRAKGDWSDLFARLDAARVAVGLSHSIDAPPQPTGQDFDVQVLKATAPLDIIAQATGAEAPQFAGAGFLAWLVKHRQAVLIGSIVIVGGIVMFQVVAPALAATKGLAALAA